MSNFNLVLRIVTLRSLNDVDREKLVSSDEPNDFEVWLNTDVGDFDGLCIGCGPTREIAIAQAVAVLKEGLIKLSDAMQSVAVSGG